MAQSARRALAGNDILLSHFPYSGTTDIEDSGGRYDQWRLPRMGAWLLHGHTHSSLRQGEQSVHVGLDAWDLTPVSINVIAHMLDSTT